MEPEKGISEGTHPSHAGLNRVTVPEKIGNLAIGDDVGGAGHDDDTC